jgi:hypothetical protein
VLHLTEGAEAAAEALAMDDVAMLAHAINDNESEVWTNVSFIAIKDHLCCNWLGR